MPNPNNIPDDFDRDLHPNSMAGVNDGSDISNPGNVRERISALDLKETHDHPLLDDLSDSFLKEISILPEGTRLEQGATYIDLHKKRPEEFKAMGSMEAGKFNWYVAKKEISYPLWNRLIGVNNPERLDEESPQPTPE